VDSELYDHKNFDRERRRNSVADDCYDGNKNTAESRYHPLSERVRSLQDCQEEIPARGTLVLRLGPPRYPDAYHGRPRGSFQNQNFVRRRPHVLGRRKNTDI